jgi:hypothetical protein
MQGQTLAQVTSSVTQTESLWHFLGQLPGTIEAQQLYALLISGCLGISANYLLKWARQEIAGSLWQYLFKDNARGTVLSVASFIGLAITSIAAGVFTAEAGAYVGWTTVMWFGLTNGFAVDAIANKGTRAPWTDEQREAKTKEAP